MKCTSFSPTRKKSYKGFTLIELLVALGITAVIVAILVTVTATALEGYSTSRNLVKASREAKAAFDQITRDLESLTVRSGNDFDWLWISTDQNAPGPTGNTSPNSSRAVFFTAATDRYNGEINTTQDRGGDISAVGYQLLYRDPVTDTQSQQFSTFVLYRQLINPDITFNSLIGQPDLESAYSSFQNNISQASNFVCENVYEFSLSFQVEFVEDGVTRSETILVVDSGGASSVNDFRIRGDGITSDGSDSDLSNGRVIAANVSLTIINDNALEALRNGVSNESVKLSLLEKNSYYFAKSILLPQP